MITFYINKSNNPQALGDYVLGLSNHIYIHCDHLEQAREISQLLWSYPDRFIPNQISDTPSPYIITIGYTTIPECGHLINISTQLIEKPHTEWVISDLQSARDRYKRYKSMGYELDSHSL